MANSCSYTYVLSTKQAYSVLLRLKSTAQHSTALHSTAQHSTAQHSTAQHSTAQHSTALLHQRQRRGGGLQVLGGARGEVQLSGVAQEVDGAMVEGVPRGRPGGALVINIRHAGVVGLVEALIEGRTTLSTCHMHTPFDAQNLYHSAEEI